MGADVIDAHGLSCQHRQCQSRSQDLAASFAMAAVNDQKVAFADHCSTRVLPLLLQLRLHDPHDARDGCRKGGTGKRSQSVCVRPSMRQQHGNLGVVEDMLCRASEDDLSEAAASEGALQHKVGADIAGLVEDDLAGGTLIGLQSSAGC